MNKHSHLFLRLGLAFVFLYAGISGLLNPDLWIGFIPAYLRILPDGVLLFLWGVFEILLALWLLSGWKTSTAGAVSSIALLGAVLFNLSLLDVVFRDIGLFFASLALLFKDREKGKLFLPEELTRVSPAKVSILGEYEKEEKEEEIFV